MDSVLYRPSGTHPTSEFEHFSIPVTLKNIFNLKEFFTKPDAWAGSFDIVVNRSTPRKDCPEKPAETVKKRDAYAKETTKLSDFQEELVQVAAALKGDSLKLVENITVSSGLKYIEDALSKFYDDGQKVKKIDGVKDVVSAVATGTKASTNFVKNFFS